MFLTFGLVAAAIYFYRRSKRRGTTIRPTWSTRATARAQASGELGERLTQAKLHEALKWLCGSNYYLHDRPIVIEHAPGARFPTIEIDHLAITPFGVFIFETKNWSGWISPSLNADFLLRQTGGGKTDERRSPSAQNRTKLAFLRSILPAHWHVGGAGVFASPDCSLSPELPIDLIALDELKFWLRQQRAEFSGHQVVDTGMALRAIRTYEDSSPNAAERHRARILQASSI